jgi:hypothetical protein
MYLIHHLLHRAIAVGVLQTQTTHDQCAVFRDIRNTFAIKLYWACLCGALLARFCLRSSFFATLSHPACDVPCGIYSQ